MRKYVFKFKRFECRHERSSLKIGVDAVVLGAWVNLDRCRRILDVGTGCGVIALMLAQRVPEAEITGVDIDTPSVEEAELNFSCSPWGARMKAEVTDYLQMTDGTYDLIISNPPYFDSGVLSLDSPRMLARHQGTLSPSTLLLHSSVLLNPSGRVAMILPIEQYNELVLVARNNGWRELRACKMRGHQSSPFKRVLIELGRVADYPSEEMIAVEELTLEQVPGVPTEEYRSLCHDFYLKF